MTAVIEFGKLKIAEYKEELTAQSEAEEAEEPEKPTPTDAELTFCAGVRGSRRPRRDLPTSSEPDRHQP
ncbi:MAG: hypothetical protein ACLUGP_07445 [Faecalibacterium prausnitzii]